MHWQVRHPYVIMMFHLLIDLVWMYADCQLLKLTTSHFQVKCKQEHAHDGSPCVMQWE